MPVRGDRWGWSLGGQKSPRDSWNSLPNNLTLPRSRGTNSDCQARAKTGPTPDLYPPPLDHHKWSTCHAHTRTQRTRWLCEPDLLSHAVTPGVARANLHHLPPLAQFRHVITSPRTYAGLVTKCDKRKEKKKQKGKERRISY